MRSFEIALLEIKRLMSARPFRAAFIVVCLVPLLYGVLYLWAFWDPYKRLDKLPVALVVNDRVAHVDGATLNVGADLVKKLRTSDTFEWHVVNARQAHDGLQHGAYYMALTVPRNFSARLAAADRDAPRQAVISVQTNEATNLLATQIGQRVFAEVRASLVQTTSERYLEHIFVSLDDVRTGLAGASTGAGQLAGALGKAGDGSAQLSGGLGAANGGARRLAAGLGQLSSGASRLHAGALKGADGAARVAAGARTANAGALAVAVGSRSVATGSESLAEGLAKLLDLSQTLVTSAQGLSAGATRVHGGVAAAAAATGSAAAAASQLSNESAQVRQALEAYAQAHPEAAGDATFQAALAAAAQSSGSSSQLAASLSTTEPQLRQLAVAAGQVSSGAAGLDAGLGSYATAVGRAAAGATALSGGATALSGGAGGLAAGVSSVSGATDRLAAGATSLASGSATLASGAAKASAGSSTLTAGLDDLAAGSVELTRGLSRAAEGGQRLALKLRQGTDAIPAFTPEARRARALMMATPVTLTTASAHPVPNYGTGFAPYFIPLALWVGALMAYFVIRPLSGRALASTLSDPYVALSGLWPGVLLTWLQAVIMLVVLQLALGLDPVLPVTLYAFTLVAALAFTAILQLLSAAFGTAGKFVAIVLLMLQLTSSAGTFPIEIVPSFFQTINPFLPMTYTVGGLRQAISGGDASAVALNALILLGFAALAVGLTMLTAHRRREWTMDRLKPVLSV